LRALIKTQVLRAIKIFGLMLGKSGKKLDELARRIEIHTFMAEIHKWRIIGLEPGDIQIGRGVKFGKGVKIRADKGAQIRIADDVFLRDFTDIYVTSGGNLSIGRSAVLGVRCLVRCRKLIEIGDEVSIGPDCKIIDHVHSLSLKGMTPNVYWSKPIKIGTGVGLFSNVFVGMGSEIGEFSKVSLNTVIKGPVPPSCFVGGDPVKVLFSRGKDQAG